LTTDRLSLANALAAGMAMVFASIAAPAGELPVHVAVVEAAQQRYPTVGDWQFKPDGLHITVTRMSDPRYETLVAAHELVEAVLCRQAGVSEAAVDAFDKAYERHRPPGDNSESGDSAGAPYHRQHLVATRVERHLAKLLKVNWRSYAREIERM
jgi:hypothetical protein